MGDRGVYSLDGAGGEVVSVLPSIGLRFDCDANKQTKNVMRFDLSGILTVLGSVSFLLCAVDALNAALNHGRPLTRIVSHARTHARTHIKYTRRAPLDTHQPTLRAV